jgi:ABC-2 type transport system ATP-binding protein
VRSTIGIAPQSLSLYDELTAKENLDFFGSLYGLAGSKLRDRVIWSLGFAGLEDRQHDRVGTFSGGMRRRLNIAVALIHEPQVLLLDEPTVGVDPQSRNHIFDSITQLKSEGITLLYTTHYMEEAQRLCDRVAIVDHGKLLALDSVDGLVASHGGSSVVEAEIKSSPENINLPGRVEDNSLRFESEKPLEEVARLTGQGVQFQTLRIAQPDLESVFLSLTGRSLRD